MIPPSRYRNGEQAKARFGELADAYAQALCTPDEPADRALDALDELGRQGPAVLERALRGDADAATPGAVRELFAELAAPPFTIDPALIDRGARTLARCGFVYAVATKQALYWGYSSAAAVKPLAFTGELRQPEAALRRLTETATWTLAVVRPGQLHTEGPAWRRTVRVRLVHARVRRALRASGQWQEAAWGAPINQADQAMTLLEFCHLPLRMLRLLGVRFSEQEIEGVYALWRYVGHLIGVPATLNPEDEVQSARLLELVELTRDPPDADSMALVTATLSSTRVGAGSHLERRMSGLLEGLERELAWHHLAEEHLRRLGFPDRRSARPVQALGAAVRLGERLRLALPAVERVMAQANTRLNERLTSDLQLRAARTRGGAARPDPSALLQPAQAPVS